MSDTRHKKVAHVSVSEKNLWCAVWHTQRVVTLTIRKSSKDGIYQFLGSRNSILESPQKLSKFRQKMMKIHHFSFNFLIKLISLILLNFIDFSWILCNFWIIFMSFSRNILCKQNNFYVTRISINFIWRFCLSKVSSGKFSNS